MIKFLTNCYQNKPVCSYEFVNVAGLPLLTTELVKHLKFLLTLLRYCIKKITILYTQCYSFKQ